MTSRHFERQLTVVEHRIVTIDCFTSVASVVVNLENRKCVPSSLRCVWPSSCRISDAALFCQQPFSTAYDHRTWPATLLPSLLADPQPPLPYPLYEGWSIDAVIVGLATSSREVIPFAVDSVVSVFCTRPVPSDVRRALFHTTIALELTSLTVHMLLIQ